MVPSVTLPIPACESWRDLPAPTCYSVQTERVAVVIRLIAGKTGTDRERRAVAWVEFGSESGSIQFIDVICGQSEHRLLSLVPMGEKTRDIEKAFQQEHGIELLQSCGYGRPYGDGDYQRLFSAPANSDELNSLSGFAVGVLQLLFGLRSDDPVKIDFFVPGPVVEKLPQSAELPEEFRDPYCEFRDRHHASLVRYHRLMATKDDEPLKSLMDTPKAASEEMQRVLDDFPHFLATLESLGDQHAEFVSVAKDNQTELSESLYVLRRRYRSQLFN